MSQPRCDACRYWQPRPDLKELYKGDYGNCHRHAPRLIPRTDEERRSTIQPIGSGWPLTPADDWCGEWEAKAIPNVGCDHDPKKRRIDRFDPGGYWREVCLKCGRTISASETYDVT